MEEKWLERNEILVSIHCTYFSENAWLNASMRVHIWQRLSTRT